jgi:predicted MFS family arabinose efflux permease
VPSPLRSSSVRRILVAYTVNRLGTWFGLLAVMLAVFDHTHSALAVAALLLAWQALPAFVVPALIARVEASRHRGELSGLYLFEALVTAALAGLLLWGFWLPAVLLLAALDGTAALAAGALLRAELARAARAQIDIAPVSVAAADDHIGLAGLTAPPSEPVTDTALDDAGHEAERKANAALNVAFSASFVIGPVLGGAVVATAGAPTALLIDAGSFLICAALLIDMRPHVEEVGGDSVRNRLRAAWRHINEAPSLRALLLTDAVAFIFFESAPPIEVTYAKATLHAGDRGFGLLLTAWGAGAVLGSLLFARSLRRPLGVMLSAGTLAVGLAYVGFAVAPSLVIACIAALVGGIGNGVELPALFSIVQRLTPQHLHGRLMGAIESLSAVCVAVGLPLGGALVALSSPRPAFVVVGLGAVASALALFRLSRRASRLPPREHTDPSGADSPTEPLAAEPAPK